MEVDGDEVYAALLTEEFAAQQLFPLHVHEALRVLHKRGFLTRPLTPLPLPLPLLPKYRLNPHHRSALASAAVLCSNQDYEPLHIFPNLVELTAVMHLRGESILKVCLQSNMHVAGGGVGDFEEEEKEKEGEEHSAPPGGVSSKWPRTHSNLRFKWADEMTSSEKESLAVHGGGHPGAPADTDKDTDHVAAVRLRAGACSGGADRPVGLDRIRQSLLAWKGPEHSTRAGAGAETKGTTGTRVTSTARALPLPSTSTTRARPTPTAASSKQVYQQDQENSQTPTLYH